MTTKKLGVTGATGHLGAHVIDLLLEKVPAAQIVALVRDTAKAAAFAAKGVEVRRADYNDDVATWEKSLAGVGALLLISSSEVGKRVPQHATVVDAAKRAGVAHLAYTSILHADSSRLMLAGEHKATEEIVRAAGIPFTLLRNGWYNENYTETLAPALEHGVILGSAGNGKIAGAARRDYAAAAVAVLLEGPSAHANKTYELAGDTTFTRADVAEAAARQSGKPVAYKDLPSAEFEKALEGIGLPAIFARVYADCDDGVARGELENTSGDLHRLIGRSTTPLEVSVSAALRS